LLPYVQEFVNIEPGDEWEGIIGVPEKIVGTWELVGLGPCVNKGGPTVQFHNPRTSQQQLGQFLKQALYDLVVSFCESETGSSHADLANIEQDI
jgi:hypothetical protein